MNALLRWLYTAVTTTVARGKVTLSQAGRRGLVQVQMLEGEVKVRVEHMLPYGRTARPAGGDAVLLTVGGTRDHVICICIDNPALRIPGLAPGEFGDSDGASMVVYRSDSLRILSTRKIAMQSDASVDVRAPAINLGAVGATTYVLLDERALAAFNAHTHEAPDGTTSGPSVTLAVGDHTTTAMKGA